MSTGAWIMPTLGARLNYGLLAYFISVAGRKDKKRAAQESKRAHQEDCPPTEESAAERCY